MRRQGFSAEDAQDLPQAFFANFLQKYAVSRAPGLGEEHGVSIDGLEQDFVIERWSVSEARLRVEL